MRNKNKFFFLYVIFVASGLFLFPSPSLSLSPPSALLSPVDSPWGLWMLHLLHLAPFPHHVNHTMIANNHHTVWWKSPHMLATPYSTTQPEPPPATTPLLFIASRTPSSTDLTQLTPNDPHDIRCPQVVQKIKMLLGSCNIRNMWGNPESPSLCLFPHSSKWRWATPAQCVSGRVLSLPESALMLHQSTGGLCVRSQ